MSTTPTTSTPKVQNTEMSTLKEVLVKVIGVPLFILVSIPLLAIASTLLITLSIPFLILGFTVFQISLFVMGIRLLFGLGLFICWFTKIAYQVLIYKPTTTWTCCICLENTDDSTISYQDMALAPCNNHYYCRDCTLTYVLKTLEAPSTPIFPPRCCQELLIGSYNPRNERLPTFHALKMGSFLGAEVMRRYMQVKVERDAADATYCSKLECSAFIQGSNARNDGLAKCWVCGFVTCIRCKGPDHGILSTECPEDRGLTALMQIAHSKDWKRCPVCPRVIERQGGCHIMHCFCGAEFCYGCGTRIKGVQDQIFHLCPNKDTGSAQMCTQWQHYYSL